MILVSIDCATGFMARHDTARGARRPTHVVVLPNEAPFSAWTPDYAVRVFRDGPPKEGEFNRRLPLVVAV